jgi:hypothetical protein
MQTIALGAVHSDDINPCYRNWNSADTRSGDIAKNEV